MSNTCPKHIGYWLFGIFHWLLVMSYWLLVIDYVGNGLWVIGYWLLWIIGYWLLAIGY